MDSALPLESTYNGSSENRAEPSEQDKLHVQTTFIRIPKSLPTFPSQLLWETEDKEHNDAFAKPTTAQVLSGKVSAPPARKSEQQVMATVLI